MVEIFVRLTHHQGGVKVGNAMLQQMLEIFFHFIFDQAWNENRKWDINLVVMLCIDMLVT